MLHAAGNAWHSHACTKAARQMQAEYQHRPETYLKATKHMFEFTDTDDADDDVALL